jgi:5-methylthioadenosine/S-adenosylhomocysteine deaminase
MGRLSRAGAVVSIGTDGVASNNDLSMLGELSTAFHFHRVFSDDSPFTPEVLFFCATRNGAKSLRKPKLGVLKESAAADFFVFDDAGQTPPDPFKEMIDEGESARITDLFVNGKQLMKSREITTLDERAVLDKASLWQEKISRGRA